MRAILTCYTDDDSDFVINDLLCVKRYIEKLDFETFLLLKKPPPPEIKFPKCSYVIVNRFNYRHTLYKLCKLGSVDKMLIYFSCHSSPKGILIDNVYIRVDDILKGLKQSEVFCIFDCCNAKSLLEAEDLKSLLVFYSCEEDQKCGIIRINSKRYSLFTNILMEELIVHQTPMILVLDKVNKRVAEIKSRLKGNIQNASSNHKSFFNWLL